ncbi:hypothetical protein M422DRAFT_30185, partial [Sphaerobolus stellatus SS14]
MGFENQPLEILDKVLSNVEHLKEFLSISLTSIRYRNFTIPDHLHYRHLQCDPRNNAVWNSLTERPRLA